MNLEVRLPLEVVTATTLLEDVQLPRIVVITPVFNEEDGLARYEARVRQTLLNHPGLDVRVLLIDDGSVDQSWPLIQDLCRRDPHFRGIRLSRNFGVHTALTAGFLQADGDAVVTLQADLQDPPEVILEFISEWQRGAKIVWGARRERDDTASRSVSSQAFTGLLRRFAMPPGSKFQTGSFLLADRRVVECFRQFREHKRITFALFAWTGFDQAIVYYSRVARQTGRSSWTFARLLSTAYDAFVGFSMLPIKIISWVGLGVFVLSMIMSIYLIIDWFVSRPMLGWTSIMVLMSFLFGVQFLMLGLLGEYLARIYLESTQRPLFFVSDEVGQWLSVDDLEGSPTGTSQRSTQTGAS